MQDTCSKFSKFLSKQLAGFAKVFCNRRYITVDIPSPSPIPSYIPRCRKHSPQARKMVANMNTPRLAVYQIVNIEYVEQRAQFTCPDSSVKDICWDSDRQVVIILNGANDTHYMVDCSNTESQGQDITLRDTLSLLGYSMRDYIVTGLTVYEGNIDINIENALDTSVKSLQLMQFNIRVRVSSS